VKSYHFKNAENVVHTTDYVYLQGDPIKSQPQYTGCIYSYTSWTARHRPRLTELGRPHATRILAAPPMLSYWRLFLPTFQPLVQLLKLDRFDLTVVALLYNLF